MSLEKSQTPKFETFDISIWNTLESGIVVLVGKLFRNNKRTGGNKRTAGEKLLTHF